MMAKKRTDVTARLIADAVGDAEQLQRHDVGRQVVDVATSLRHPPARRTLNHGLFVPFRVVEQVLCIKIGYNSAPTTKTAVSSRDHVLICKHNTRWRTKQLTITTSWKLTLNYVFNTKIPGDPPNYANQPF